MTLRRFSASSSGQFLELGQAIGGTETEVMRAMVYKTIEQHLTVTCIMQRI